MPAWLPIKAKPPDEFAAVWPPTGTIAAKPPTLLLVCHSTAEDEKMAPSLLPFHLLAAMGVPESVNPMRLPISDGIPPGADVIKTFPFRSQTTLPRLGDAGDSKAISPEALMKACT